MDQFQPEVSNFVRDGLVLLLWEKPIECISPSLKDITPQSWVGLDDSTLVKHKPPGRWRDAPEIGAAAFESAQQLWGDLVDHGKEPDYFWGSGLEKPIVGTKKRSFHIRTKWWDVDSTWLKHDSTVPGLVAWAAVGPQCSTGTGSAGLKKTNFFFKRHLWGNANRIQQVRSQEKWVGPFFWAKRHLQIDRLCVIPCWSQILEA